MSDWEILRETFKNELKYIVTSWNEKYQNKKEALTSHPNFITCVPKFCVTN